jgi:ankyrin repeat protein
LIEAGADVNACDTGGRSALEAAALNKDEGLMAILLSAGASAQDVACRVREGKVKLNDRIASMLSAIAARTTMQSAMRRGALPASIRRV